VIRADLRRHGRFYTPERLAREVVARTLAPLTGGRGRIRVCDPACGDGVFLREAARFAPGRVELCGVDTDDGALRRVGLPGAELHCADALRMDWGGRTFDAVLGNPPWISYSGRHAQAPPPPVASRLKERGGWPSLHALFVELAVRLARRRIGLLLPAQVCELAGYAPLRAFVRKHCAVETPLDCGEQVFVGVTQPVCALFLERRKGGDPGAGGPFFAEADPYAGLGRPPAAAFGDIGVHTGNCARKLLRPGGAPIREGKDVAAFRLGPPRRGFDPDAPRAPGDYFRAAPLARYRDVPILLRQTAARPVAALHTGRTWFRNSVLACFGVPGLPDEVTVAWLNSGVIADWHRARVREANQRAFPQLKIRHLRDLPLPPPAAAPGALAPLARAVARDGRLDLSADLDAAVAEWFARA